MSLISRYLVHFDNCYIGKYKYIFLIVCHVSFTKYNCCVAENLKFSLKHFEKENIEQYIVYLCKSLFGLYYLSDNIPVDKICTSRVFPSGYVYILCWYIWQVAALLEEKQVFTAENDRLLDRINQAENFDDSRQITQTDVVCQNRGCKSRQDHSPARICIWELGREMNILPCST